MKNVYYLQILQDRVKRCRILKLQPCNSDKSIKRSAGSHEKIQHLDFKYKRLQNFMITFNYFFMSKENLQGGKNGFQSGGALEDWNAPPQFRILDALEWLK